MKKQISLFDLNPGEIAGQRRFSIGDSVSGRHVQDNRNPAIGDWITGTIKGVGNRYLLLEAKEFGSNLLNLPNNS